LSLQVLSYLANNFKINFWSLKKVTYTKHHQSSDKIKKNRWTNLKMSQRLKYGNICEVNERTRNKTTISFQIFDSPGCSYGLIVTFPLQVHTIPEVNKIYVSSCLHLMVHKLRDVESHPVEPTETYNWFGTSGKFTLLNPQKNAIN
jgi:hypothetical protein